jgi:8-oxo-dGTP pyrophosphatase MutT (NUDIX family)
MSSQNNTFLQIDDIVIRLAHHATQGLRGWEHQKLMSPPFREPIDMAAIQLQRPKLSAVMLLLFEKNNNLSIVFTKRQEYDGVHSGQISFPGGRKEEHEDYIETAIRECKEEIGWEVRPEEIILPLSALYIPPSHFLVYPFVAVIQGEPIFNRQEREVKSILEIPLQSLFAPANKKEVTVRTGSNQELQVPAYVINDHVIWGATAVILSELEQLLQ